MTPAIYRQAISKSDMSPRKQIPKITLPKWLPESVREMALLRLKPLQYVPSCDEKTKKAGYWDQTYLVEYERWRFIQPALCKNDMENVWKKINKLSPTAADEFFSILEDLNAFDYATSVLEENNDYCTRLKKLSNISDRFSRSLDPLVRRRCNALVKTSQKLSKIISTELSGIDAHIQQIFEAWPLTREQKIKEARYTFLTRKLSQMIRRHSSRSLHAEIATTISVLFNVTYTVENVKKLVGTHPKKGKTGKEK